MIFSPEPSKQAQGVIFSKKANKISNPLLRFNNSIASQSQYQKHVGIFVDAQLKVITTKLNKSTERLRKLQKILPRPVLVTMYKVILEPNLGYVDVNYNEACIEAFHQRNTFNIMPA